MTRAGGFSKAPRARPRGAVLAVCMTREQERRQDVQVEWLREAIAAQSRPIARASLDRASLMVPRQ